MEAAKKSFCSAAAASPLPEPSVASSRTRALCNTRGDSLASFWFKLSGPEEESSVAAHSKSSFFPNACTHGCTPA